MNTTPLSTSIWGACFLALALALSGGLPERAAAQSFDPSGFVKSEYLYDTRQVVAARESEFHLYPARESDVTDTDNLGGFSFFSRLGLGIHDLPEALGGTVTGYFEADFFGPTNDEVSTFRLRRAFVKMAWENREVLFGQEWSPLFTLAAFPRTVATTTGAPFQPFARQPQIRLTLKPGALRFIGAAAWQRDAFADIAFNGTPGIKQQQFAALPAWHGHVQYHGEGGRVIGAGAYLKALRPIPTNDRFFTGAVQGYATIPTPTVDVRAKATYGADLTDHLMTGGYVYNVPTEEFHPLNTFSTWVDLNGKGTVAPGLYAGYLVNLGSREAVDTVPPGVDVVGPVVNSDATRAPEIDAIWRVAPRLNLNYGAVRFALELEVTSAQYASAVDADFAPSGETNAVTNVRGNATVFLFF